MKSFPYSIFADRTHEGRKIVTALIYMTQKSSLCSLVNILMSTFYFYTTHHNTTLQQVKVFGACRRKKPKKEKPSKLYCL